MIIEIIGVALLVTIAGTMSTITGFGTSTISIPILLNFYSLQETILFVGLIHFAGTIWKMVLFRKGFQTDFFVSFGIPAIIASYIGAQTLFRIPAGLASKLLGAFLIVYVFVILLWSDRILKKNRVTNASGGILSGFFAGIFGMGGAIRAVFLSAYNLPKTVYLFTTNSIAFSIDAVRLSTYLTTGLQLPTVLWISLIIALPFSLAGAWLARSVVHRIPQKYFRIIVGLALGVAGIKLLFFT